MGSFQLADAESFGGWIQNRRRAMNLTRHELADKVGCAAVTIKKIERNERKPSRQMAELLAEHLGVPRLDRDAFVRMARGMYLSTTAPLQDSLRVPAFLQHEPGDLHAETADFVERHKELTRLKACLDHALAGSAMPVFLLGDAGSGKTALMREFARMAHEAHPKLLVAGGQCNAQTGPGDPFRPFRDILGILTGDVEIDWIVGMLSREQTLRNWESIPDVIRAITTYGPHLPDVLLAVNQLVQRLAPNLVGSTEWFDRFQVSAYAEPSTHPGLEQSQVLEELTQVFRAVAVQHPLLLILDDLQWVDGASLNLFSYLCRRLARSRVLVLASCRTGENVPGQPAAQQVSDEVHTPESLIWELARQYGDIQIRLDQASPSEGRAFIDALLDLEPNRLGEAFREDLYVHTRGHPLFTVEILRSMRQYQNLIQDDAGYWIENKSLPPAPPPARVEAVIEQRLARLDPSQRELLEVASVEGEAFTAEIVANVLGLDLASAMKSFTHDLGQQHHLIQEQGQLHVRTQTLNRFQFHHMLIQEHLYVRLAAAEKRRLHRRTAEELEKTLIGSERPGTSQPGTTAAIVKVADAEWLDAFGPALLHHFWLAEEWIRAAAYARELGQRARQRYAMREAISYYERALLALDMQTESQDELIFDALLGWQDAAFNFKPYEDQLKQLSRAEVIARNLYDKPRLIQALHRTANVLLAQGRWTQAGPALTESLALADELGNEGLSVRPAYFRALMTTFADPAGSLKWIALAEDLSRKHHDSNIEALALATESQVLAQLGEFARSQQAIDDARRISASLGSPLLESDVDLFAAWACLAMGNPEQALEFGQRSVERAIATDNMDCICNGLACIGYGNLELGRIPEAAASFEKGIQRSDVSGAMFPKLLGQAGLAMTRFISGHPEALEDLERVAADLSLFENHVGAANADYLLGTSLHQLGELERASAHLHQAVDFYRRSQMCPSLARTLRSLADLMESQGRAAEAQACRAEAESFRSLSGKTQ